MSETRETIPADVMRAAEAVFQTEIKAGQLGGVFMKERIARAILAERERCAKIVEARTPLWEEAEAVAAAIRQSKEPVE